MKTCPQCQTEFNFTQEDEDFLKKVSPELVGQVHQIPAPTLCPDCRQQRRLTWRNERRMYLRSCDLCQKKSLSIYREDCPFPVYCLDCWWSDKWDPKEFGREFDPSKPFFEQFKELQDAVPRMMVQQSQNENSEYTANVSHLKDCYLLFSSDFNKDCYYGVWIENSQDSLDNLMINNCQLTHDAIFSDNIYNCSFVIHSTQCSDSAFLLDCKNCSNCFMCYGLRNKEYCIGNKQYGKEEYFEKVNAFPLTSRSNYENLKSKFLEMIKDAPYLYMWRNGRVIDSSGDFLTDVQNCQECYEIMEGRDCKLVQGGYKIIDAHDCSYIHGELGYENCECFPMPMRSAFNLNCYNGNDVYYSDMCMNQNSNLFGCVSLRQSKYCILNKEYSKEEYESLATKIIAHMEETGEWGEFFPAKNSPFHYNETNAQDFFPLSKEEALAKGYSWLDKEEKDYLPQEFTLPDDMAEVDQSITKQILACEECGKNYKIIAKELELLQKIGLPIPRKCFECRHNERSRFRKTRHLSERQCHKCSSPIQTTYSPDRPEKVYCEKCYMEEVY